MGLFSGIKDAIGGVLNFVFSPLKKLIGFLSPDIDPGGRDGLTIQREGSDNPLPVVYGRRKVGAAVVHKFVSGDRNQFLNIIATFCHGPIDAIEEIQFNGIPSTDPQWSSYNIIQKALGTDTQTALTGAVNAIDNWTSAMQGKNVAYAWIQLEMDKKQKIWRGEPQISAIIRGRTVFDWRTGVTAFSRNPAVCNVDYLTNPIYGRGLSLSRLNLTEWTAAADFADETTQSDVTVTTCTPQPIVGTNRTTMVCTTEVVTQSFPRYQLNALIDTDNTIFDNHQELLRSYRGSPNRTNGLLGVSVETTGEPSVTFDESNVIGDIDVSTGGTNNRYNRVIIRFPNKLNDYETDEAIFPAAGDPLHDTWLAEDNGKELAGEFDFETFADKSDAVQMAEIIAKRSRADQLVSFRARGLARLVVPNDIIGLTNQSLGWVNKPLRVDSRRELGDGVFEFECLEHQNAIYPWSGSAWSEQVGGTTLGNPETINPPTNLALAPDPELATTGQLTWNAEDDSFIRRFDVELEKDGTTIYIREELGESHTIPKLDIGSYTVRVFAVSTVGTRSGGAALAFTLSLPSAPTDLGLTVSNNTITSIPVLAGLNLGTQFEFDIVEGDGTGHTPEPRIRARTGTFSGLIPSTEYTVFVRTLNALGASGWVSETTITTADSQEIIESIQGAITESELWTGLNARIDLIDGPDTLAGSVAQRLLDEANARDSAITVTKSEMEAYADNDSAAALLANTLNASFGGNAASALSFTVSEVDSQLAVTTTFNSLDARVTNAENDLTSKAEITYVDQSVADEESARTTQFNSLTASIESSTFGSNLTFEAGQTGWNQVNTNDWLIENNPTRARRGNWVLKSTRTIQGQNDNVQRFPAAPGEKFIASCWIDSSSATGGRAFVNIRWEQQGGAIAGKSNGSVVTDGLSGWQQSRVVAEAPANAARGHVSVIVGDDGAQAPSGTWYIDDFTIAPIAKDDDIGVVPSTVSASVTEVNEAIATASGATATSIDQLSTQHGDNVASIQTQQTSIDGLEAKFTVKIDVNGHVAGYGLAVGDNDFDGATDSLMTFSVDTFAIASPGAESMSFIVQDGRVVMDAASVVNLVVTDAMIDSMSVNKITGDTANFVESNIGLGVIDSAKIAQVIQSTNFQAGTAGWRIDKSGSIEAHNITLYDSLGNIILSSGARNFAIGLFQWTGSNGINTNTTISGADNWTFNSNLSGTCVIKVLANDAEGAVHLALNSVDLGVMDGPNGVDKWYTFGAENLIVGQNTLAIWSTTWDGGVIKAITVQYGQPKIDANNASTFIDNAAINTLQVAGGSVTSMTFAAGPDVFFQSLGHGVNQQQVLSNVSVDLPTEATGTVVSVYMVAMGAAGDETNVGLRIRRGTTVLADGVSRVDTNWRELLAFTAYDPTPGVNPVYNLQVYHPGISGQPDNDTWIFDPVMTIIGGKR